MGNLKNTGRHSITKKRVQKRSKYMDQSRRFVDWVNGLGFEQTPFGRLVRRWDQRFGIRRAAFLFLFCLALSAVIFLEFDLPYQVKAGDIAPQDIKSPFSFQIIDEAATAMKRSQAEDSVPPVFDYDPDVYESLYNRIYRSFRRMRKEYRSYPWPSETMAVEESVKDFFKFKPEFEEALGRKVPDRLFQWLVEREFSARLENILINALVKWSAPKVLDAPEHIEWDSETPLVVRSLVRGEVDREYTVNYAQVADYQHISDFVMDEIKGYSGLSAPDQRNLLRLSRMLVVPNLTYNSQETLARREMARETVLPIQISIQKNQTIVNEGATVLPTHVVILEEIRALRSDRRTDLVILVAALLLLTLILVFLSYLRRFTTMKVKVTPKDLGVMAFVSLLVVAVTKLFLFMTGAAFLERFGELIPDSVFLYAAPVAAGPMLVGMLMLSGEVVWIFTAFLATVLAILVDFNFSFLLVALIGGIAAARGVYACKARNEIYLAGIRTGLVNALVITLILVLQKTGDPDLLHTMVWTIPAGFVGGVLSSMLTITVIPLIESMFNRTTDIKLLELSSLNHPVMQEMIVRAPGTYHHSLVVGSMVENAATEIGANALMAKVMAYYHDIGKIDHAQYFIENQRRGHNPHDHISPYMSKTILIAHVKDGAEMAMHYKLGKPIIDGILQHHGTTLISYFYNKALEEEDENIHHVEEDDFRYPGPKPQFKEAALVMLADSIEAAARSLDEPTPARLQSLVKNIIQSKFLDGQLEECNLTLKDLSVIENSFERVLLGIYHQRIDYPTSPRLRESVAKSASQRSHKKEVRSV